MFNDYSSDVTGFESYPEKDRIVNEASCQTNQGKSDSQETQTSTSKNIQIQTEKNQNKPPEFDVNKLASFLNRVYPQLIDELNSTDLTFSEQETSSEESSVSKLHVIRSSQDKKVSSLSWNCTGVSLAITHCEVEHENWCTHDGIINLYNTSKQNFTAAAPVKLNTVSCVTSIAYHPWEPSVLACGLYNGDVVVYDMRRDEDQVLTYNKKEKSNAEKHSDTVTSIVWTNNRNGPLLVSAGRDGKILFWKISFTNQTLKVHKRLFIPVEHAQSKLTDINTGLQVFSISFWNNFDDEFVIAVDGGNVLHCSLKAAQPFPLLPTFDDPVEMKYPQHRSVVTCVNCRADSELFASCGTDGEIHVCKAREAEVLYCIYVEYPLVGVEWSDITNVLAAWGSSCDLEFFNVSTQEKLNFFTLKNGEGDVVTAVKFNKQRKGILALGTDTGSVSIWHGPANIGQGEL